MVQPSQPKRKSCAVALALLLGGSFALLSAQGAVPLAAAKGPAHDIFTQTHATGMVMVIVRGDGSAVPETRMQFFGLSSSTTAAALDEHSVIRLCSLTKIFTTDLLARMVNQRAVKLTDPLQLFAQDGVRVPTQTLHGPAARPLTLGDLATHTAGLPREMGHAPARTAHFTFPNQAQRWAWLPRQKLKTTPGNAAVYSNVGFDLLGDALANAAGKPYASLLTERTTRPLGMADTTFTPSPAQCARLLVPFHPPGQTGNDVCTDTQASAGSSGLYSTPHDIVLWLAYLLGASQNPAARQPASAHAAYLQPSSLTSVQGLDHAGEPSAIGLGWIMLNQPGTPEGIVQKTGGGAGFSTYIAFSPVTHTAIFFALTEGEGGWQTNPFIAANNILLGLAGLPPLPPAARHHAPAHRHASRAARLRRR